MARAGFYAVESGKISFRRDGNWYSDEERIDNARIALLFSQSIRRDRDGSYYLEVGDERAAIRVDDTPYVVKAIEDDGQGGVLLVLNDETREPLVPANLEIGADHVLYSKVKDGSMRARFLRNAYYHLSSRFDADRSGRPVIVLGERRHVIAQSRGPRAGQS